ncbi:LysE family translocator [Nocardioides allogilvus]|uniref:LysE family translocator n=1 Tax=Nocardioides allogilvus TaxID=2072017 RepID=UPI000D321490|nr:LysE family translocator [Nocardioides allogilvus]
MISWTAALGIALITFGLAITPGPNSMYLVSRSLTQGRLAGLVSLGGVVTGFMAYLLATTVGLAVLFSTVPLLFVAIKVAGAAYLLWLAISMIRKGSSVFRPGDGRRHSASRLYAMGLATCLLNPKIALFYAALLPQLINPDGASIWAQTMQLGLVQIAVATLVNICWVVAAATLASVLARSRRADHIVRIAASGLLAWFAVHLGLAQPATAQP